MIDTSLRRAATPADSDSANPPGSGPQPKDLTPGPELEYAAEARSRFRDGDVLLFRGKGFVSWAIAKLTRSEYSHAGLAYLFEGRVYCLEAVGSGVRLVLMSVLVDHYRGGIDYFEHVDATPEQRSHAISFAFRQLGKLYDKAGLVRFFWAIVTGRMEQLRRDEQWFCSELVAAAYDEAGAPLLAERPEAYVSPADLALSDHVLHRFQVKK